MGAAAYAVYVQMARGRISGHRARLWLSGLLAGWTVLILCVAGFRAWSVMAGTVCPSDESVAAFCRAQVLDSALQALKLPALVYLAGAAILAVAWTATFFEAPSAEVE